MLRLIAVITLSLFLHLTLFEASRFVKLPEKPLNLTEIEVLESLPNKNTNKTENNSFEKPIAPTVLQNKVSQIDKPAEFMAEQTQRFDKQTQAKIKGLLKNATIQSVDQKKLLTEKSTLNKNSLNSSQKTTTQNNNLSADDIPEFAKALQNSTQKNLDLQSAISSNPYNLPSGIEFGGATNLNADAHIYSSFYSRVIELFYVRWAQNLDEVWNRLPFERKKALAGKSWTTDVEIQLNPEGLYQKGFSLKNSGFKPFDDAGLNAFKEAQFFPNPPKAKVEADGLIRLRYRIQVQIR